MAAWNGGFDWVVCGFNEWLGITVEMGFVCFAIGLIGSVCRFGCLVAGNGDVMMELKLQEGMGCVCFGNSQVWLKG